MWIKIRTKSVNFSMPVPVSMVGFAIRAVPDTAFVEIRKKVKPPYNTLVTKGTALYLWQECKDALLDCKGLELVHVEASDGTFVSIKM